MKGEQALPMLPIRPAKRLGWPSVRTCCADRPGRRLSIRRGRRHGIQSPDPPSVLEAEHPYRLDRDSSLPDHPPPLLFFFREKVGPLLTPTFAGRPIPHAAAAAQGHRLFALPPSSPQITQTMKGHWPTYKQQINGRRRTAATSMSVSAAAAALGRKGRIAIVRENGPQFCALPRLPDS